MNRYQLVLRLTLYTSFPIILCGILLAFRSQLHLGAVLLLGTAFALISATLLANRIEKETSAATENFKQLKESLAEADLVIADIEVGQGELLRSQHAAFRDLSAATIKRIKVLLKSNQKFSKRSSQFQSILATMSEGVLLIEAGGRILYCNQFAGKLLGRKPRSIEKKRLWEVVRTPGLELAVEKSLTSRQALCEEFEIQRTHRIVEMNAIQIEVNSGAGLVIVLHDFTELRRLERLRREFVSNVSHELKTPLTSIQLYTETLLDGALEDHEHNRSFVESIQEQSERLQQLIQDMLRLARIEAQSEAFQLEQISLSHIANNCVEARSEIAKAREVELRYRCDAVHSIHIIADHEGLQMIFDNLINNALNHTPQQGKVEVHCWQTEDQAIVEVKDNGIGIAAEHHPHIFERFYRVDQARSRGMGGTGLGLAIVKHCVNAFDGEIQLESEVGSGTTFRVSFPLAKTQALVGTSDSSVG